MDPEILKEMEKALERNEKLKMLTVSDANNVTLPKEFCRHLMIGVGTLSEMCLSFDPRNWPFPNDGRLVYVSHMLCDLVGCSV